MSDIVMNVGVIVTLSYFGLGIAAPTPDWGAMMADGQQFLAGGFYGLTMFPAAAVILTSLSFSLIGEGLAHALRIDR
jgi:peptide/nickel transport system permease protein